MTCLAMLAALGLTSTQAVDLSGGLAPGRATGAVSWSQRYAVWPGRLELGWGARFTSFAGFGRLTFRTGDPALIRERRLTALAIGDPLVQSLNLQVLAIARVAGPLEVGFNIDVAGLSFGPRRTGDHQSASLAFSGRQRARVSALDLLLVGDRDRGQLNSEFFLGWHLDEWWTVRAGLSHVATEYMTVEALDDGNRRFRRFTNQLFAGISRRL